MMNAEIASEIIRSRIQTPMPVPARIGTIGPGSAVPPTDGEGITACPTAFGSENVPGMKPHCMLVEPGRCGIGASYLKAVCIGRLF